jgi:hypothetical protein
MPHASDDVDLAKRRLRSLELRRKGYSIAQITQELRKDGWFVTTTTVAADVNRELRTLVNEFREEHEFQRQLELDRLDVALKAITPRVELGDDDAIMSMLKIQLRRAKLLGLDAPTRREVKTEDVTPTRRSREELLGQMQDVMRRLQERGITPALPSAQIAIEAETIEVPKSDQSASESEGEFE